MNGPCSIFCWFLPRLYIYEPKNIRNWLVPLSAVFAFLMIVYGILVLADKVDFLQEHYRFDFKFNVFLLFWTGGNSSKFIVYVLLILITTIISFLKLSKSGLGKIVTMRLVVLSFILGILLKMLVATPSADPPDGHIFPSCYLHYQLCGIDSKTKHQGSCTNSDPIGAIPGLYFWHFD